MEPNSEINKVHFANFGDRYTYIADYLRDPDPPRRRSYAPYIDSVYKLDNSERCVSFQSECLLPRNDRGRPRVLLLFSNAHPESIKNGMFHTAETGVAALWTDLCHAGLFSGDRTILGSAARLRNHCLNVTYDGPFALGFACYWLFPTFHPDDLKDLFGSDMEPPGFENTKSRLDQLLAAWQALTIISFNGKVLEALTGLRTTGYLKHLSHGLVRAEYRTGERVYPIFQTYPTGYHFAPDASQLRQASLRRITDALSHTACSLESLYQSKCRQLPEAPGIYLVRAPEDFKPAFVNPGAGGWFKGKNPNIDIKKLRSRWWVPDFRELYIGRADNLRERVWRLLEFGHGNPVAHWGGRLLWQIKQSSDFLLDWYEHNSPAEEEHRLLAEFKSKYGRLPFANLQS